MAVWVQTLLMPFGDVVRQGMKTVRSGSRLTGRKRRRVWVVTGSANCSVDRAEFALPITAGAAMNAGLPIAIGRAMATAAEGRTLLNLQMPPISGLQQLKVGLIVAIKA